MGSLTAQPQGTPGAHAQANPIVSFVPMLFVIAVIYFLLIRPQQRVAKQLKNAVDALKSGDKVLTQGGIYGVVTGIKGDVVQVRIAENVRVDVSRQGIAQVIKEGDTSMEKGS
jgi:preprotein translocase subunit YajC